MHECDYQLLLRPPSFSVFRWRIEFSVEAQSFTQNPPEELGLFQGNSLQWLPVATVGFAVTKGFHQNHVISHWKLSGGFFSCTWRGSLSKILVESLLVTQYPTRGAYALPLGLLAGTLRGSVFHLGEFVIDH